MRQAIFLAIGIIVGWFGNAALVRDPPPARAEPQATAFVPHLAPLSPEPVPLPHAPTLPVEEEMVPAGGGEGPPPAVGAGTGRMREKVVWVGMTGFDAHVQFVQTLAKAPR